MKKMSMANYDLRYLRTLFFGSFEKNVFCVDCHKCVPIIFTKKKLPKYEMFSVSFEKDLGRNFLQIPLLKTHLKIPLLIK